MRRCVPGVCAGLAAAGLAALVAAGPAQAGRWDEGEAKAGSPVSISALSTMDIRLSGRFARLLRSADIGKESDLQNLDNSAFPNYLRLNGRTKNDYGNGMAWGVNVEMGFQSNPSNQSNVGDENSNTDLYNRATQIWWDTGRFGKVKLGYGPGAARSAGRNDLSGDPYGQNNDNRRGEGIVMRDGVGSTNLSLGELFRDYQGRRDDYLTYYTPRIAGFNLGVSYGNDDAQEYALNYRLGEWGEKGEKGTQVKASLAYLRNLESNTTGFSTPLGEVEDGWDMSASWRLANGISVTGAYGIQHPVANNQPTNFAYYSKLAYDLGQHTVSADYGISRGILDPVFFDKVFGTHYGLGYEWDLDPYGVFAGYEIYQADRQAPGQPDPDDVKSFTAGLRVNF